MDIFVQRDGLVVDAFSFLRKVNHLKDMMFDSKMPDDTSALEYILKVYDISKQLKKLGIL